VAGRTDFARYRRDELPSTEQNLELYRISRDFLRSRGYRQITAYDWKKDDSLLPGHYRYEENWHSLFTPSESDISGIDAWGLGFAGISFLFGTPEEPGWSYMNSTNMDDYARAVDAGRFPVERGFRYTSVDLRLTTLFQMLQAMEVNVDTYRRAFGVDPIEEFAPVWQALNDRGWVVLDGARIRLVGDGVFYTPLVQHLLAEARLAEMRRSQTANVEPAA
jgi:oxygen-independent coproporphyrinogen-3 oxidase